MGANKPLASVARALRILEFLAVNPADGVPLTAISKELGINSSGKESSLLNGFSVVNREKLLKLSDKKLADFARRGYLELAYFHLKSLANFQRLGDKIMQLDPPTVPKEAKK